MMRCRKVFSGLFAAVLALSSCGEALVGEGSFADGGLYVAGTSFGGSLAHRRVNLKSDINPWLTEAHGNNQFILLQLPKVKSEEGRNELIQWLQSTRLELADALYFGEELESDAEVWLDPLYAMVKKYSDIPVYVWYSMPLGPRGAKADGYWYDYYGRNYSDFRNKVREYLSTGEPLGITVDASLYSSLKAAREQVLVCKEFDLPVNYFAAEGQLGSPNNWYSGPLGYALLVPARNFVFSSLEFQRRSREPWNLSAGDFMWGEVIGLASNEEGSVNFRWSGIDGATVYGFGAICIESDGRVKTRSDQTATLDYQFWSLLPLKNVVLSLESAGSTLPTISLSRCGRQSDWMTVEESEEAGLFPLGDLGREFRLRIELGEGAPAFKSAILSGHVNREAPPVLQLYPDFYHGWRERVIYNQNLDDGSWRMFGRIDHSEQLEPGSELALRGLEGRANSAEVIWKFSSPIPLDLELAGLEGTQDKTHHGGSFSLGISLDGEVILHRIKPEDPVFTGEVILDLAGDDRFSGIDAFYLHLRQSNSSGIRGAVSSRLKKLRILADLAE